MYKFIVLSNATANLYEKLTYPTFRLHLRVLDSDNSMVALGVHLDSQPVGLALAQISQDKKSAEILSLFIVPEHRQRGLGKALLTSVEKELRLHGCSHANLVYVSNATAPFFERILKQCNWSTPRLRMLVCSGSITNIRDAYWLKLHNAIPSGYTIFPWIKLTEQERYFIQGLQAISPWYPKILCPFQEEEIIEQSNSLGLRYKNQVVGWMIAHRVALNAVRYTKLFVKQDLQGIGRAIPLLATAINLHLEHNPNTKAVFTVEADNTLMVKFLYKRLAPYLESIRQSWGSSKSFNLIE
ncbi:GCN5-related N-acetyltransferase [Cylindrospermum sp. NIES-4074]|nr:GCN5-related N-acetyltransferase [Cylindrospermum sp. NIES-4074]